MASEEWKSANVDRLRRYRNTWYERNKANEIPKAAARRREYRERNQRIAQESKAKPCADCGTEYPYYVMHFDHLGEDKDGNINKMVWKPVSEAVLRAEIAKCEAVCANCHAERTHQRMIAKKETA